MSAKTQYSQDFKENVVKKLLMPDSPGMSELAKNLNIPITTLYGWKSSYVNNGGMKKSKLTRNWTAEQKLELLIKTAAMNEVELGEYLRSQGLYTADLERFKKDLVAPSAPSSASDPEALKLKKQNLKLEKELRKKDRALAEYSARVILLKKSHEIWGEEEDD